MYDELVKELRYLDEYSKQINPTPSGIFREAADAIEELEKQLENETEHATALNSYVPQWIPCSERLPEEEGSVLIFSELGGIAEGHYSHMYGVWVQYRWNVKDIKVTHWMPLPKPPDHIREAKEMVEKESES